MDRHDTLLISGNSAQNRALLRDVMSEGFNLLEAVNIRQALMLLKQNIHCIAAVLLDVTQLEENDEAIIRQEENAALLSQVPIIVICRDEQTEEVNRAFGFGASDVIPIHYDPYAMLHRIENIVDLHLHKKNLEAMVEEQAKALRRTSDSMVDVLSSIIEYRSVESGQHILRIRRFTQILLEEVVRSCPEYHLTDRIISIICSAAALHDIGKIAIPDSVLLKPGKLTEEEMELMKTHAVTGCGILDSLTNVADQEYLRYAHNICHYHHERWDGSGYPEGLSGEDIPICAQVVGLADVYDALTTRRVYKEPVSFAQAVNMILKGECGAFSPKLLECFKHVTHRYEELARDYADGLSPNTESFDTTLPAPAAEQDANSIENLRGKYYALAHYVNGFLMELNMDLGVFHVVYNPYPELTQFHGISTLDDLTRMVREELVHPDDRARMEQLMFERLPEFFREGLRRQSSQFRLRSKNDPEGAMFEIAFLRVSPLDAQRRKLIVIVRKLEGGANRTEDRTMQPLTDAVYCCRNDQDFTLLETDGETGMLAGYTMQQIRQAFDGKLILLVHPDDRETVRTEFRSQLHHSTEATLEFRLLCKDGSICWVVVKSRLAVDHSGSEYLVATVTDITRFKQANDNLQKKLERYEIILAQTENVLFDWDVEQNQITYSDTWQKFFGFAPAHTDLMEQLSDGTYFHPDDLPLLFDRISNIEKGSDYEMVEVRIASVDGRYLWCRIRATALRDKDGKLRKISGIIINIDAEKQAERALQDRAERDSLTKLLNKDAGRKRAEAYFARFPEGTDSALMIIDLDNFKQVNDQYGHLFGDAVLTKVSREIQKLFRNQDIVSRIGGDEFLVIMRGVADRKLVENRCQQLLRIFTTIFREQQYQLPLSCSIGVALSPEHGKTYFELFNRADLALYRAKALGKNKFVFFQERDEVSVYQNARTSAVNNRIDSDEEPGLADDTLVRYAFQRLYASKNVQKSVEDILALVGQKMNVSRVYVFENSDDNRYCSNTYEWCNEGIAPEIQNLQKISYETDIPNYEDNFNEQGIFYCPDIKVLPKQTYDIVAPQGIKSMLHCAIREGGIFRGYIGFDECVEQRYWTKEQIHTLSYFSEMLSLFLLKQRKQERSQRYAQDLQSILDNQNAWIYIIDPDTCELKYLNAKTRTLAPEIQPGMRCYKALMGRDDRCPNCPGLDIRRNKNCSMALYNQRFGVTALAEATLIQWDGTESCLLTCREIPNS